MDGQRVLDACAAPGGKAAHLAELARLDLTVVELDRARASRIEENLARIGANASLVIGDAARPAQWWDGRLFDRILLDAPCTGSGIVRRHPDIPWLRRPTDVAHLATLQAEMLRALWPLLGVGGRLLYVVCSLFPEEGREQIARFAAESPGAREVPLPAGSPSVQLIPIAGSAALGRTTAADTSRRLLLRIAGQDPMNAMSALRACLSLLLAAMFTAPVPALADERIGVMAAALEPGVDNGAIVLNATFEFELPQALEEAVQKGIALYFNIEFELYRNRWYWFDRKIAASTLVYRLSYSPLTRKYRLARGGLSQSFESLDEALALLKTVRGWKVADPGTLAPR
jgi:hypothetical protein